MIIGLLGFAGAGKGTVADILVDDYEYHKLAFADTLKDITSLVFGWNRALLEGDTEVSRAFREKRDDFWSARFGREITPRIILQQIGTEAMRDVIDQNIWVYSLEQKIQNSSADNIVITDVRFPNEIELIRKLGGKLIRVKRGPEPVWYQTAVYHNSQPTDPVFGVKRIMQDRYSDIHISEWAWIGSQVDGTIHNEGTKQDLKRAVEKCLQVVTL